MTESMPMSNTGDAAALYLQVLGRPADSAGLANAVAALDSGVTIGQLRSAFSMSAEARANLRNAYLQILGRSIDSGARVNATAALGNGETFAQVQNGLAISPEAKRTSRTSTRTNLAEPRTDGLACYEKTLANGSRSLAGIQAFFATSQEAQKDLASIYQSDLGRAPDAAGLAGWTQFLATGGSLAAVQSAAINSTELTNAYQSALGHGPDLAAARSELVLGVQFTTLQTELGELSGGAPPRLQANPFVTITPETIAGSANNSYVYSALNNDALITAQPENVTLTYAGASGEAVVDTFNPGEF